MIDRGRMFETPTYRWIPARTAVTCEYEAIVTHARAIPTDLRAVAASGVKSPRAARWFCGAKRLAAIRGLRYVAWP